MIFNEVIIMSIINFLGEISALQSIYHDFQRYTDVFCTILDHRKIVCYDNLAHGECSIHEAALFGQLKKIDFLIRIGASILAPVELDAVRKPFFFSKQILHSLGYSSSDSSNNFMITPLELARIYDRHVHSGNFQQECTKTCEYTMLRLWYRYHTWRMRRNLYVFHSLLMISSSKITYSVEHDHYSCRPADRVFVVSELVGHIASYLGPYDPWQQVQVYKFKAQRRLYHSQKNQLEREKKFLLRKRKEKRVNEKK